MDRQWKCISWPQHISNDLLIAVVTLFLWKYTHLYLSKVSYYQLHKDLTPGTFNTFGQKTNISFISRVTYHVILWAKTTFDFGKTNKSTFIERSIYQSYLYFLTQILPLGVQWRKIIDKYQVCQYMVQKACRHFAHFAFISTWHATRVIGKKGGLL